LKKKILTLFLILGLQALYVKGSHAHGDPIVFFRITGGGLLYILSAVLLIFSKEISTFMKVVVAIIYIFLSFLAWRVIWTSVDPNFTVYLFLYSVPVLLLALLFAIKKWRKTRF
jgi:heme O synthase-like polyprenyltransferase